MPQLVWLLAFMLSVSSALAACTIPSKRRPWHTLSNDEKLEYIHAELCLMQKPAVLGLPGPRTRFDDLQAVHQRQAYAVHFAGAFLPFHRLFVQAHETALRTECNYSGYQPYWHEQPDAGHFHTSAVFDATYGFGGDGDGGHEQCLATGPFANYTNPIGPAYALVDHCISRQITDAASRATAAAAVDACLAKPDFGSAWPCIECVPHMANGVSSPGDPIFYLHHAWLDKVFWDWQARDREERTRTIGGPNVAPDYMPGFPPRPDSIPRPTGADGDPGMTTTMGHVLNMFGNGPNRTIADL
ncbi:e663ac88-b3db-40a2-bd44-c0e356143483 [Thermothielavioides terrestris]|uniref:E663ac88-b3db-40a2-bd44-c0e356143483 n=1 Tax=Thermothielavioides terrestris TaxID=2587410 RepID=A0A446BXJ9_9PEZI|nr:e663ac88-b3db-40a2-bd44-c0e356143483 [Thermothielavioides terrestris]